MFILIFAKIEKKKNNIFAKSNSRKTVNGKVHRYRVAN